jgi:hypothetical protein
MPETVVDTDARTPVELNVTGLRSTAALTTRVLGLALAQRASWVASQPSSTAPGNRIQRTRSAAVGRLRRAAPKPLTVGPAIRACITTGTSFAQEPPADQASWLDEAEEIVAHHLSVVALDLLSTGEHGGTEIDPRLLEVLRSGARRDAMVSISADGTSAAALRSLGAHGIPFLIIKGPATARFHPEPAKRTYSDLDLLVSPRRFAEAINVLVDLGYVRKRDSEPLWPMFDRLCTEGFNLHRGPIENVDLHHHVSPWQFGKHLDFDTLFERSDEGEIAGVPVRFASARDTLVISSLHVVNDLGKDNPSFNSWRDIAILFDRLHPQVFDKAFEEAGLGWFETYIQTGLVDLGATIDPPKLKRFDPSLRSRGEQLRLGLMGWNGTTFLARHPLGWALRLPSFRALCFLLGAAVPSPSYIRERYPNYRAYWHDGRSSVSAAVHGSDFRHERIGSIERTTGSASPPAAERGTV